MGIQIMHRSKQMGCNAVFKVFKGCLWNVLVIDWEEILLLNH